MKMTNWCAENIALERFCMPFSKKKINVDNQASYLPFMPLSQVLFVLCASTSELMQDFPFVSTKLENTNVNAGNTKFQKVNCLWGVIC